MWHVLSGETTEQPRLKIPLHMDYVDSLGGFIYTYDGVIYKLFKESCVAWYDFVDGNATVLGYSDESATGSTVVDTGIDASTFCDTGDTEYYRLYDITNDPSEITNLYYESDYSDALGLGKAFFCSKYDPNAGYLVDSSYITSDDGDGWDTAIADNDKYLTSWKDTSDVPSIGDYPMSDYWSEISWCDSK